MTRHLTQHELRDRNGEIMRELDRGEDFIVTRDGTPVGELKPYRPRKFVPREVVAAAFAHIPPIDLEEFRAESDAFIDPTPREWFES